MIRPLRKYHLQVWRSLALLLPIAFASALLFRPINKGKLSKAGEFQFEFVKSSGTGSIKIKLLNALQSPSCLVYALPKSGNKVLLGVISREGTYAFNCPEKIIGIELFDIIHQKEILTHYIDHEELP